MRIAAARGQPETARTVQFVGRGPELQRLGRHLDALWRSPSEAPPGVLAGGSVMMLVGEAGIGKTQLARQFADGAATHGTTVLWGTAPADEVGPPHGPWAGALTELVRHGPVQQAREQLGAGAPALARALPAVREVLPDTPPATPLEPADERLRLWEAVSRWLRRAAESAPVVVVLDDLERADVDTLRLLRHVARTTARSPVLLLCVYREPARRRHGQGALQDVLRDLRAERPYHRLRLAGLSEEEVGSLLGQRTRVRLGAGGLSVMTRMTRGNPFYVELARRFLVDGWGMADAPAVEGTGAIPGRVRTGDPDQQTVPDSAAPEWTGAGRPVFPKARRELLDRRIAGRSAAAATLIRLLAAIPGSVPHELLGPVTELAPERILDGLDEDARAGLVRVGGTSAAPMWEVAHPIVRDALADRWTVARRAHLHRRVAQAMERLAAGRERESAATLGWHWYASAALPGADRGIRYLLLAAEAARGSYAHVRAVTMLRMALKLVHRDDVEARADVLGRLAQAEADAGLPTAARSSAEAAVRTMAEARVSQSDIVTLLSDVARSMERSGAPAAEWRPLVERATALLRGERQRPWARLAILRAGAVSLADGPAIHAGRWPGRDPVAVALLRASPSEDERADALHPLDQRTRVETASVLAAARTWRRPAAAMRATAVALRDLVDRHGAFGEAAGIASGLVELARHHGALATEAAALLELALCHLVLGDGEVGQQTLAAAERLLPTLDPHDALADRAVDVRLVRAAYLDDGWHGLGRHLARRIADPAGVHDPLALSLAAWAVLAPARLGRSDIARDRLPEVIGLLARTNGSVAGHAAATVVTAAAVWEMGAADQAAPVRTLATDLLEGGVGVLPMGSPRHAVARMTALLGHGEEALELFAAERAALDAAGLAPLSAVLAYDEALTMLSTGVGASSRADELLAEAADRSTKLGMHGWAARSSARRGGAAATSPVTFPDGLTAREVDVLRLLVSGLGLSQIAERLYLDPAVVERHAANLGGKTGRTDPSSLRDYAATHGLIVVRDG